jgi:uncharacterized protein (TIGR02444 family)
MALGTPTSGEATDADADELWAFSVGFYGYRSVGSDCLALQDTFGADVNLVLLLLYAATRGIALNVDHVARLDRSCAQWRQAVIRPLREARRATGMTDLRAAAGVQSTLKSAELACERIAQGILARELRELSRPTDLRTPLQLGKANLLAYREFLPFAVGAVEDLLVAFRDFVRERDTVRSTAIDPTDPRGPR